MSDSSPRAANNTPSFVPDGGEEPRKNDQEEVRHEDEVAASTGDAADRVVNPLPANGAARPGDTRKTGGRCPLARIEDPRWEDLYPNVSADSLPSPSSRRNMLPMIQLWKNFCQDSGRHPAFHRDGRGLRLYRCTDPSSSTEDAQDNNIDYDAIVEFLQFLATIPEINKYDFVNAKMFINGHRRLEYASACARAGRPRLYHVYVGMHPRVQKVLSDFHASQANKKQRDDQAESAVRRHVIPAMPSDVSTAPYRTPTSRPAAAVPATETSRDKAVRTLMAAAALIFRPAAADDTTADGRPRKRRRAVSQKVDALYVALMRQAQREDPELYASLTGKTRVRVPILDPQTVSRYLQEASAVAGPTPGAADPNVTWPGADIPPYDPFRYQDERPTSVPEWQALTHAGYASQGPTGASYATARTGVPIEGWRSDYGWSQQDLRPPPPPSPGPRVLPPPAALWESPTPFVPDKAGSFPYYGYPYRPPDLPPSYWYPPY